MSDPTPVTVPAERSLIRRRSDASGGKVGVSRAGVEAALREVYDPCSQAWSRPLSVADLGLVREVSVVGGAVAVRLSLTAPFCMAVAVLMQAVEQRLADVPGVHAVRVDIDQDTPWRPELMTERGRRLLANHRTHDRARTGPTAERIS
jgi:metal-sulfur cluster biosynthetic enzyme